MERHSAEGLYEYTIQTIGRLVKTPGFNLIDVGAGSGAFLAKLGKSFPQARRWGLDNQSFTSFRLSEEVEFRSVDLNQPFAQNISQKFDIVLSLEVIEHLENPIQFLGQARDLLKPEGHLIISTPNVENILSRLVFLLRGELRGFRNNYPEHITPILSNLMKRYVEIAGLEIKDHEIFPPTGRYHLSRPWVLAFGRLLNLVAPLFLRGNCRGESHVYVLSHHIDSGD